MTKVPYLVIRECQHAFMDGRQILYAALIANEVVDEIINKKRDGVICKLDMQKVYDRVNWNFVDFMLNKLGFGKKWRKWVKWCISTTSFAVLVNRGPSSFVKAFRGFRQGDPVDPLSPHLFIVAMEALNRMLIKPEI